MTTILNKFKSLSIGIIVLMLFVGVTFSSCNSGKKSENKENVEAASESKEHPADSHEHPADSTKAEHPTNKEHPAK